jgi:hypothetical protein
MVTKEHTEVELTWIYVPAITIPKWPKLRSASSRTQSVFLWPGELYPYVGQVSGVHHSEGKLLDPPNVWSEIRIAIHRKSLSAFHLTSNGGNIGIKGHGSHLDENRATLQCRSES